MLEALAAGESDPEQLADLVRTRFAPRRTQLREALRGRITEHHRLLLRLHLRPGRCPRRRRSRAIDAEVEERSRPFATAVARLTAMPGRRRRRGQRHRGGDRRRHEPLPDRRPSDLLGRAVPPQRRERRQAPLHPAAQGRALAQDHAGAGRLGRRASQDQLPAGPVPALKPAAAPRRPSSPWPPRCSPPSTSCSSAAPPTTISDPTTSRPATASAAGLSPSQEPAASVIAEQLSRDEFGRSLQTGAVLMRSVGQSTASGRPSTFVRQLDPSGLPVTQPFNQASLLQEPEASGGVLATCSAQADHLSSRTTTALQQRRRPQGC